MEDDEATDSDAEPVVRTRGQKRAAATPSQSAHEEESVGEVAAVSPKKKKKSPSQLAEEKRSKRLKQSTILDVGVSLTRPMGKVLEIPAPVGSGLKKLPVSK